MKIVGAQVILRAGTDVVYLDTELPSPTPKVEKANLSVSFHAEHDTGINYVRKQFGFEPTVVNTR